MGKSRGVLRYILILMLILLIGLAFGVPGPRASGNCVQQISIEEAAKLMGMPAGDLNARFYPMPVSPTNQKKKTFKVPPCSYSFRSKSNFSKSISFTVYLYNDPGQARADYTKMKGDFSVTAKVEVLKDLGDEAFWVADKRFRRLMAYKGSRLIDVLGNLPLDQKKKFIKFLLKE